MQAPARLSKPKPKPRPEPPPAPDPFAGIERLGSWLIIGRDATLKRATAKCAGCETIRVISVVDVPTCGCSGARSASGRETSRAAEAFVAKRATSRAAMTARAVLPDPWRKLVRVWGRRVRAKAAMASDIAGTSAQWAAAFEVMDSSRRRRLLLKEQNRVLDTIVTVQDAEREAAKRALRARLEREWWR